MPTHNPPVSSSGATSQIQSGGNFLGCGKNENRLPFCLHIPPYPPHQMIPFESRLTLTTLVFGPANKTFSPRTNNIGEAVELPLQTSPSSAACKVNSFAVRPVLIGAKVLCRNLSKPRNVAIQILPSVSSIDAATQSCVRPSLEENHSMPRLVGPRACFLKSNGCRNRPTPFSSVAIQRLPSRSKKKSA